MFNIGDRIIKISGSNTDQRGTIKDIENRNNGVNYLIEYDNGVTDYANVLSIQSENGPYKAMLESVKADTSKAKVQLSLVIEHALKISYSTDVERIFSTWMDQYEAHYDTAVDLLRWDRKKPYTSVINNMSKEIQEIYADGIKGYDRAMKKYSDLREYRNKIPEKCPFTLDDILNPSILYMVYALPNKPYRKEFYHELYNRRSRGKDHTT